MSNSGWIGVDLDGTLAKYDGFVSSTHIGEPIPKMVDRVKQWLARGIPVKIFTARVTRFKELDGSEGDLAPIVEAIQDWTQEHIGASLEVTNVKDFGMIELWDDRAVGIDCNTGEIRTHENTREGWKNGK